MKVKVHVLLALAIPAIAPAQSRDQPRVFHLESGPRTVEWGYFDASAKPIVTVRSGDIVELDTPLGGSEEMEKLGIPERLIRPEMRTLENVKDRSATYGNILVGPIAVDSAEPGDVLEIHILEIRIADTYAVNVFHPGGGTIPDDYPYAATRVIDLDTRRNVALFAPGIEIPLKPFFGTMGVAPPRPVGRISDGPPGYYAGNLDNKDLTAGTILYIPIQCNGALFSVGDGHAGQGDGEVDGTAIEAALWGRFQLILRKDMHLLWPRAESATFYMTMGFDIDLNKAAQMAVREMIDYLVTQHHLTREQAYMLTSVAADLRITQTVDGVKGVHAVISKAIFRDNESR